MREFDDASLLATNTPLDQMNSTIANLQRIRRTAEDLEVPSCLNTLKQVQLAHMNTVINTMLGFLSNSESEILNQNIELARQLHDQYTIELASLLGLTVEIAPTEAAEETPQADIAPTDATLVVTNPGPTTVNLRAQPALDAKTLGILDVNASAVVVGRTADAHWYHVEFTDQPGQTVWIYASLVQISDPNVDLPVIDSVP